MQHQYTTVFDEEQEEIDAYDFFNDGYPGEPDEYSEFDGWRDLV